MSPRRLARLTLGLVAWTALLGWTMRHATSPRGDPSTPESERTSLLTALAEHIGTEPIEYEVRFPRRVLLEVGDAVRTDARARAVGEVTALLAPDGAVLGARIASVERARLRLFDRDSHAIREGAVLTLLRIPDPSGRWVLATLIDDAKAERIRAIWSEKGLLLHRREVAELAAPVLEGVLSDLARTLEEEARPFVERHREDLERLVRGVESRLGEDRLARLFEAEIWPSLQRHLEPLFDEIGAEAWEKLPLWGFAWRVVYQSLPLTDDDHFQRHWDAFIEAEMVPLLRAHAKDFIAVGRSVARDALANPRVADVLRDGFLEVSASPETHRLGYALLREVFLDNPRFRERLRARWSSAETQALVDGVATRLEPVLREMADVVVGSREEGISPEFARVLRSQIFQKDARQLRLAPGPATAAVLSEGATLDARVEDETP